MDIGPILHYRIHIGVKMWDAKSARKAFELASTDVGMTDELRRDFNRTWRRLKRNLYWTRQFGETIVIDRKF